MQEPESKTCLYPDCPKKPAKRGLCYTHSNQFNKLKSSLPVEAQQRFDDELVEKKYILPADAGGRPPKKDVFTEIADKYRLSEAVQHNVEQVKAMRKKKP